MGALGIQQYLGSDAALEPLDSLPATTSFLQRPLGASVLHLDHKAKGCCRLSRRLRSLQFALKAESDKEQPVHCCDAAGDSSAKQQHGEHSIQILHFQIAWINK